MSMFPERFPINIVYKAVIKENILMYNLFSGFYYIEIIIAP